MGRRRVAIHHMALFGVFDEHKRNLTMNIVIDFIRVRSNDHSRSWDLPPVSAWQSRVSATSLL